MLSRSKGFNCSALARTLALSSALAFGGQTSVRAADDILTYVGADRAQKLLDGARAEGQVVLYATIIVNQALRPLAEAFQKKYPFVKMTFWRGDSEEILTKASTRRARGMSSAMCWRVPASANSPCRPIWRRAI
jgi:uncharacterized SAM-dependent methyltransferase